MGITSPRRIAQLVVVAAAMAASAPYAIAEDIRLTCAGENPEWALSLDGSQARFNFPAPTEMDIPHVAQAENRDWPRAMTLIGDRDSAIVILDITRPGNACDDATHTAQVLTQRGQTPIFLVGCCQGGPE